MLVECVECVVEILETQIQVQELIHLLGPLDVATATRLLSVLLNLSAWLFRRSSRDGLIDGEDEAGSLGGGGNGVGLHVGRLPDAALEGVDDTLLGDVDTHRLVSLVVQLAQLLNNVGGIEAGVLDELAWDDLECLGIACDQQLLLP